MSIALLEHNVQETCDHQINWFPGNIPAGIYYVSLEVNGSVVDKGKVILLK